MRHVGIWHVQSIKPVVTLITDGASAAACEPDAHSAFPFGIRVCPACYPSSYPSAARHRKAIA